MSQVKFGTCISTGPRPYLIPNEYPGYFTPSIPPPCKSNGRPVIDGRAELHSQSTKYARGTPTMDQMAGTDNLVGIAAPFKGEYDLMQTQEGAVYLPRMPVQRTGYMPSVTDLLALPYTGSRFSGISDRYYNH